MKKNHVERRRKDRRFKFEINGWHLTLTRPTRAEMSDLYREHGGQDPPVYVFAERFVVDWRGVKEADLFVAGGDIPVDFDKDLWSDIAADDETLWAPICERLMQALEDDRQKREERAKN